MLSDNLVELPSYLITAIGSIIIARNLLNKTNNKSIFQCILIMIIYAFIIFYTHEENYTPLQTIINCVVLSLSIKEIFNVNLYTSFACSVVIFILVMISELLLFINPILLENLMLIRMDSVLFAFTNILVMTIGYLLIKIKFINQVLSNFILKFEKNNKTNEILILIFLITSLTFFCYIIFLNRNTAINKIIILIFIMTLCVLFYIHMRDKNKYNSLISKYNNLLDYAHNYEEELEKDKLIRHEHKNQLAVIKGMTKNKKVIKYIDELLKNNKTNNNINIKGINHLPKGGLRGLIYYKTTIIRKKNINYNIDISRNVKDKFLKLNDENKKILSYIVGVFLDNAIEECEDIKNSNIFIEIYSLEKEINIIISNTLHNKINLKKIGEKGYTTKGKNHGNGIFLIKKLLKENNLIKVNTKLINNYFVQKIKIDLNNEDA